MKILDLGLTRYREALKVQEDLLHKRIAGLEDDCLIVTEHRAVVTFGRLTGENNVLDKRYFEDRCVDFEYTSRGGNVTYHSPGQVLLYPIVDLEDKKKDVSFYIDFLEKTVSNSLNVLGVSAERGERRGVWVGGKKIAFTGVGFKKWVTYHGVSVNINNDIDAFLKINPCGEKDILVTSAKEVLGKELDMARVKNIFIEQFIKDFKEEYKRQDFIYGAKASRVIRK